VTSQRRAVARCDPGSDFKFAADERAAGAGLSACRQRRPIGHRIIGS